MKRIKKIFSLLLTFVMVMNLSIGAFAAEGDPNVTLTVDKSSVAVGEEVTVTVGVDEEISGITSMGMNLNIDTTAFELVSAKGENGFIYTDRLATKGNINFVAVDNTALNDLNVSGTIGTVVLKALAAVESAQFSISNLECYSFDESYNTITEPVNAPSAIAVEVKEAAAEPEYTGYAVYTSDDISTTNGSAVTVNVMVTNSDETVKTYNAYDITVTYDKEKLTFNKEASSAAGTIANISVKDDEIRIIGLGADNTFDTAAASLNFTMNSTGTAEVEITAADVGIKGDANDDIQEAEIQGGSDETPEKTVITVPYSVDKPDCVSGDDTVLPGDDYTFSYTDTDNYTYSDLTVTVGGSDITGNLVTNTDGSITISGVTGDVVIEVKQTPNSYNVTVEKDENATVTGDEKATYGTDYTFTVSVADEYLLDEVKVTVNGAEYSYTIDDAGNYVIAGADIKGAVVITVTVKDAPKTTTTITFTGVTEDEVEGGLTQDATIGDDFTFELNEEDGYEYTVTVDGEEIKPDENSVYTVLGEKVTEDGVTIVITKTEIETDELIVKVNEYITLDEKSMFLVTATKGEAVLAYGDTTMFWSDTYSEYCWLVVSADTEEAVLENAKNTIVTAADDAVATVIAYDYDVNQTTVVDVNDAQLVYNMYSAEYEDFKTVSMDKFLEADLNGSKTVTTEDAVAVVNEILAK